MCWILPNYGFYAQAGREARQAALDAAAAARTQAEQRLAAHQKAHAAAQAAAHAARAKVNDQQHLSNMDTPAFPLQSQKVLMQWSLMPNAGGTAEGGFGWAAHEPAAGAGLQRGHQQ